ncbi:MAG: hypothetical protein ACOCX4_08440 [Planctomycetota bacterium]
MAKTDFWIRDLNLGALAVDAGGKTVATVTQQGYVDWTLRTPDAEGKLVTYLEKESHLCYVRGLIFRLHMPHLCETMERIEHRVEDGGRRVVLEGHAYGAGGAFRSETRAELSQNEQTGAFEWALCTELHVQGKEPIKRDWVEYNNVYPARAGCCMLFEPQKRYRWTLMTDAEGRVWQFPHQHQLHYKKKINELTFAPGSVAGFFGEPDGAPVVIVDESSLPPDWAICDMYYDLHCGARPQGRFQPGEVYRFVHRIRYLSPEESRRFVDRAVRIPYAEEDYRTHSYPRLALGRNAFDTPVAIDDEDDASAFKPAPPHKVWDRDTGPEGCGSLKLTADEPGELVWSAEPPTQIPAQTRLNLRAIVKTEGATGKGIFLRVRYHTFVWHPQPHVEWVRTLESVPVAGATDDWTEIAVPALEVPEEHFDYLVWIDVVLDGPGTAWLTDIDVDLQSTADEEVPAPDTPENRRTPVNA